MTPDYSVVVPVYNGALTITELYDRTASVFERLGASFEVVFVHDHGPDGSWAAIEALKRAHPHTVRAVRLARNFGQHNAIICGFKHAEGGFIVTIDEDLQQDPADIPLLIAAQSAGGHDVVYGRYDEQKHGGVRNLTSRIVRRLLAISIPDLHPDYSPLRLIKAPIAKATIGMSNSYTFLDGYLSWITADVGSVTVSHAERLAGTSAYDWRKLIRHGANIFVTFSPLPIRALTYSSAAIFTLSVGFTTYLLIRKVFVGDIVSGYASTMVVLGMGFGLVLFGMGVIGEYIHQINMKTTRRPNFVEAEILE